MFCKVELVTQKNGSVNIFKLVTPSVTLFCVTRFCSSISKLENCEPHRLSSPELKKFLIFQEELLKPENPTKSYSLELLTYYCIHDSLAILFSAVGLSIKYPITDIWQNFQYVLRVKRKENISTSGNEITLQKIIKTFEGLLLY